MMLAWSFVMPLTCAFVESSGAPGGSISKESDEVWSMERPKHHAVIAQLAEDAQAVATVVRTRTRGLAGRRRSCRPSTFTAGLKTTCDPLSSAPTPTTPTFPIPRPDTPLTLQGLSRFTTTRGSAYCFLSSITAIRYLAHQPTPSAHNQPIKTLLFITT